jgi:hypothetical protein
MKKFIQKATSAIALFFVCGFAACGETQITVSFVQEGQETVVKTLTKGETLNDIPAPKQAEGYTVTWDREDFSALTQSVTVTAVVTPNTYVINYEIEEAANGCEGLLTVRYGEDFTLANPTLDGFVFAGWKLQGTNIFVENGKYTWTENLTLTAVWDVDNDNEYTYFY